MANAVVESYKELVKFLGQTLGEAYEVVLFDLTSDNKGIVAIANGNVSGRSVGDPVSPETVAYLMDKQYDSRESLINYTGVLDNGSILRSSTFFIKDNGKTVGMLGINFDDTAFHDLSRKLLYLVHPGDFVDKHFENQSRMNEKDLLQLISSGTPTERFHNDPDRVMADMFTQVTAACQTPSDHLTPQERERVINALDQCGMFKLKGSVQYTANHLGCSIATVYRYIAK